MSDRADFYSTCETCPARIPQYRHARGARQRRCDDCKRATYQTAIGRRSAARIPDRVRRLVMERDGMLCRHCFNPVEPRGSSRYPQPRDLELDHIVPVVAGGCSTFDNLVVSCMACNRGHRESRRRSA